MKKSNHCKTEQPLLLLRRPLPPKLPKLPSPTKKILTKRILTAKTIIPKSGKIGKILQPIPLKQKKPKPVKAKTGETQLFGTPATQDKITPTEKDTTKFLEVSKKQPQLHVNVRNIYFNIQIPGTLAMIPKSVMHAYWHLPLTASSSLFFPRCPSASKRVFREKLKRGRKVKVHVGEIIGDSFSLSSMFFQPLSDHYLIITPPLKKGSQLEPLPGTTDFELPPILKDSTGVLLTSVSSSISVEQEKPLPWRAKMVLGKAEIVGLKSLPIPVSARKPQRQSIIEALVESGNIETVQKPLCEGVIRTIKPGTFVLRGEGLKTIVDTRYEAIKALAELAVVNCQVHGRNALSLKGFFLSQCPDLTLIALQLIYLNLSFNDLTQFPPEVLYLRNLQVLILRNNPIKEIPTEICLLRYLRIFAIGFNWIYNLPSGLFSLSNLEELDVSYNDFTAIPNEIQQLSLLDKLNVDGNELTAFPPGILNLELTKLQYENTYTHPAFWEESSINSPLRLTDICALYIVRNNLCIFHGTISPDIQSLLESTSKCDWCQGTRFGEGFHIIRSTDIFGATQLPILFVVCSSSCFKKMRDTNFIYTSVTNKKIILNMDWPNEGAYNETS
ncbi:LOW QUALITY PROTEIN: leucine-rich repeat-containing protein 63 [Thomomys bottae]